MPIEPGNTWCSWMGLPLLFSRDREPSWLHSSVLELRCHRTMVHPISFAGLGCSRGFNRNYKVGREIIRLQIVVSVYVTYSLTVDKTLFMWLIHTTNFLKIRNWHASLRKTWIWRCIPGTSAWHNLHLCSKCQYCTNNLNGEVSCLIKIYWSKCKSHV